MPSPRALLLIGLLLISTSAGGCVTPPRSGERGPLVSARRLLDLEFGARRTRERRQHVQALPSALRGELARAPRLTGVPSAAARESRRLTTVYEDIGRFGLPELQRRPQNLELLLPQRRDFAQAIADDLDHAIRLLGPPERALNEIDDRRHRTDPDDDRPERSLLDRLLRRLGL